MKLIRVLSAICIFVCALCSVVGAQQPESFISISPKITFDKQLGYKTPGIGGELSAGIALPESVLGLRTKTLYATEDVEWITEHKRSFDDGHTLTSTTGLNCHFDERWFGRVAFYVANHRNSSFSKTATRAQFGGGYSYQSREPVFCNGCLVALRVTAVAFVPINDPNGGRGLKLSVDGFMPVVKSGRWGVHWSGAIEAGSFRDSADGRKWAGYGDAAFGLFLNLSGKR